MFRRKQTVDLHKKISLKQKLNDILVANSLYIGGLFVLLLMIFFVWICFQFVPPVESGVFYNHLGK